MPKHLHSLLHYPHPPQRVHLLPWMNLHGYIISSKVCSLHQNSLLVLYILCVSTKVSDIYPKLQHHTEQSHCHRNLLCSTYSSHLTTTDLFTAAIIFPFPKCYMWDCTLHIQPFQIGFLRLVINLSFLHAFSWLDSSFFLVLNNPFSGCAVVYSIHLLKDILVTCKFGQL